MDNQTLKTSTTENTPMGEINEEVLQDLYTWIDKIPLSRPKKNIHRDFSDGVLCAEVVRHFFPKIVEIHNYTPANNTEQKVANWNLLNRKAFSKLGLHLSEDVFRQIANSKPFVIEHVLLMLRQKIDKIKYEQTKQAQAAQNPGQDEKPEADQDGASPGRGKGKAKGKVAAKVNATKKAVQQAVPTVPQVPHHSLPDIPETVPRMIFEEKEQECLAKEETIQILQAKVRRLEHLLHLKDIRIEDLQQRLDTVRPSNPNNTKKY